MKSEKTCSEETCLCILKCISVHRFSVKGKNMPKWPIWGGLFSHWEKGKLGDEMKKRTEEFANAHTYRYLCTYVFVYVK